MLGGNVCRQSFKTNKTSDRRAVDDGTFALYKHFSNFMLHAEPNPFQVYGNGFIQFSSAISRGAESPSIPALLKHSQSPKVAMVFDHGFTSALFETSHLIK
jgi:hypothetical protein